MYLRLLLFTIVATQTISAWRTCDEQDFCKNTRDYLDGERTFHLDEVDINEVVTGKIIDDESSKEFQFKLAALESDTLRLTIQDPTTPRYTPEADALTGDPIKTTFTQTSDDGDEPIILSFGEDLKVNLHTNPFKIEVYKGDVNIVNLNQRNGLIVNDDVEDQTVALDVAFPAAQRAYGIPQHAERLSLPSTESTTPYRMFNVDYYGYPVFTKEALYGSIGVLYGVSTTTTSGVFWMNAAQTFVDIFDNEDNGMEAVFVSENGALELFVFGGPTLKDAVRQYTKLTGVAELPQYFSLGYHQSRYSYMSQEEAETVVEEMDNNNFPMDTLWLDIDHTDGYRYFTWNQETFPDPIGMQNKIAETGRKVVAISDPHLAVDDNYFVYQEALAEDFLVKDSAGNNYEAECWPGTSSWVDYFNPEAQEWYAGLYSLEKYVGSTNNLYIWNDMNEPAVFSTLDSTFAEDVQHYGGRSHKEVHNLYGLKQTQATKQGLLGRDPNKRPFILTRAHFAGSQRFSAMWTGDNNPSWEHLQISIPMILTESLGGMAFSGADVGGFTDNVAEDLLQRWYQLGAWYPFFRGHSGFDTEPREPYRYEEDVQERIRTALRIRYSHIPYLYTIFYEHEVTGDPIMRPLSYHYPEDPRVLDIDNQFLIGSDIMVAPVLEESVDSITTYFPGGADEYWYNVVDANVYLGTGNYPIDVTMDSIPYYYRGGSIILTIDNEVTCTADHDGKPYHMYVLLDSNGEASGNFYFDDWESFEYRNNDAYVYYRFEYADSRLSVIKINEQADYTDRNFMLSQIDVYRPASASSRAAIGRVEVKSAVKDIKMHNITATSTVLHRL